MPLKLKSISAKLCIVDLWSVILCLCTIEERSIVLFLSKSVLNTFFAIGATKEVSRWDQVKTNELILFYVIEKQQQS